jgi:hypothetical protein
MKPSSFCFRIGGTAWILLAGIAGMSFLGHHLVDYGVQPGAWPVLGIGLGGGGLVSVMVGAILLLWQK